MKSYSEEAFDKDLKDFFSQRQEVPTHIQSQIHGKLRAYEKAEYSHLENYYWVGIMVMCSVVCMITLAWAGWMFFGQTALWIMAAVYYFLTMGGMVVMLLSNYKYTRRF